jgi:hypothetical protein
MGQDIAHERDAAVLPRRVQDLGDDGFQPLMGIRNDELDTAQTAPSKLV